MELRLRTHLRYGREIGPEYIGRLRCLGSGCVFRHGFGRAYSADPFRAPDMVWVFTFGALPRKHDIYCVHSAAQGLSDFAMDGAYYCSTTTVPPTRVSEGTISLLRYRPRSN
jgi:hypothetical protein